MRMFDLDYETRCTCIILQEFLTPEFARRALEIHKKRRYLAIRPQRNERYSQLQRYTAIAQGKDWDKDRNAKLVWLKSDE